jgi:hypothetical protein
MTDIPVYSYEDLRKKADEFFRKYHPSGDIPVPIEESVEFDFKINIVPVLGLQREFEVGGFTSGDLKNIYVDEYVYTGRITRYRFTLAHKMGHIVLHRHLYRTHKFNFIHGWKGFINSMTEEEHSWLEYQGYAFAGLVLVPKQSLIKYTNEWTKKIKDNQSIVNNLNCEFRKTDPDNAGLDGEIDLVKQGVFQGEIIKYQLKAGHTYISSTKTQGTHPIFLLLPFVYRGNSFGTFS